MRRLGAAEGLILLLAAAALGSLVTAVLIGAHPLAEAPARVSSAGRLCLRLLTAGGETGLAAAALALGILLVHAAAAALAFGRGQRGRERLRLALSALPEAEPPAELARALERVGLGSRVTLVESEEPFAFTLGLLRPRVYLSTAAARRLTVQELEAVLWHERRHAEARDPLRMQVLAVLRAAFGYLPALRYLSQHFLRSREYEADDEALRRTGNPDALLGALWKLSLPRAKASPEAAAGYGGFAGERMARLLPGAEVPPQGASRGLLAAGAVTLLLLALLPALSLLATEADHLLAACIA